MSQINTYRVLQPLLLSGVKHLPGDLVDMDADHAQGGLDGRFIERVTSPDLPMPPRTINRSQQPHQVAKGTPK